MIKELGFKLIALAVFLRILVSILLFHPDIKTINFQVSFLKQGVTNIYPYLLENRASLPLKEEFVYFPLTYFSLGSYHALISTILGEKFDKWVFSADSSQIVNDSNIFLYQFFLKLPLLFADLAVAYFLYSYFKDKGKAKDASILWLFNPFTIILIYAYSNIDVYVLLLSLISLLFIKNKRFVLSAIFLGLAISFKLYPLLFVPFYFLNAEKVKDKLTFLFLPVFVFVLTIAPFLSKAFINSALLSGLSTRLLIENFPIGSGESVILAVVLISSLFFFGLTKIINLSLEKYIAIVLMIVFSFAHFHISWLLWLTPLFTIFYVRKEKIRPLIILWLIVAVSIPLLYMDRSMTIALFRIYTNWFELLPTPYTLVEKVYSPLALQSILHSVLIGLSIPLSFSLIKQDDKQE